MLRRALLASLVVLSGLAVEAIKAPPVYADSCSSCGESDTDLNFYSGGGTGSVTGTFPYGQPLLLSASVLDVSGSCDIGDCNNPSGHVYFYDNGAANPFVAAGPDPNNYTPTSSVSNNLSSWSVTVSNLAVGAHSIRALYHSGTFSVANPHKFDDSEDTKSITIVKAATSNTLSADKSSSTFGETVTFTATVAPNPAVDTGGGAALPTGNVQFVDVTGGGSEVIATQPINASGVASITSSQRPVGTRTIVANYQGDANYAVQGSNQFALTVSQAASTTAVSTSPSPSSFGQSVTLKATLNSTSATGSVAFTIDGTDAGTGTVSGGVATVTNSAMTAGSHTIGATYSGDGNFTGSSNTASHTVTKATTASALAPTSPTVYGQAVTFSGGITPGTATGAVTFLDNATTIGTSAAPSPSTSTSSLSVGSHPISFSYAGDANHFSSSSNVITHVVNKADTSIALVGPSGAVDFGSNVPISATVSAVAPGAGTPTGTLTIYDGSALLATGTLTGGATSFSVPDLLPGAHSLTAVYSGDGNFNASSTTVPLTINLTCQTNLSGNVAGSFTAGPGSTCVTANITGTLNVPAGARVFVSGVRINQVSANGPGRLAICGSTISGSVSISNATGPVLLGDAVNGRCAGNTFSGSMTINNNRGFVQIADNVLSVVSAGGNRGGLLIANNRVTSALSCVNNVPAPTNGGRPNQGPGRSGQCAGL